MAMSNGKDTLDLSALGIAVPTAAGSFAAPAPPLLLLPLMGREVLLVSLVVVSMQSSARGLLSSAPRAQANLVESIKVRFPAALLCYFVPCSFGWLWVVYVA